MPDAAYRMPTRLCKMAVGLPIRGRVATPVTFIAPTRRDMSPTPLSNQRAINRRFQDYSKPSVLKCDNNAAQPLVVCDMGHDEVGQLWRRSMYTIHPGSTRAVFPLS